MIRVLIADDSAFMRKILSDLFEKESDFEVLGVAFNGKEAVEKVLRLKPDLLTMDVNMPIMNGLQALEVIMDDCPLPVVMFSSLTKQGADATIRALELGAVDFISKPGGSISRIDSIEEELLQKCRNAAVAHVYSRKSQPRGETAHPAAVPHSTAPPGMKRIGLPHRSGMKLKPIVPPDSLVSQWAPPATEQPVLAAEPAEAAAKQPVREETPKKAVPEAAKPDDAQKKIVQPIKERAPLFAKPVKPNPVKPLQLRVTGPGKPPDKPAEAVRIQPVVRPVLKPFEPKPAPSVFPAPARTAKPVSKPHVAETVSMHRPVLHPYPAAQRSSGPGSFASGGHKLVAIGTSTGGPRALQNVITRLPRNLPCGVVIVQHMPAGFTRSLAERLDAISAIAVKEAEDQDIIKPGQVYIAPGNFHMQVQATGGLRRIALNQNPPLASHRPAVDVLFDSLVPFGRDVVSVILTGMGCDGTAGMKKIKKAGGYIIAEDESTAVVYGMPKSVVDAGLADVIVPVQRVASAIVEAVEK